MRIAWRPFHRIALAAVLLAAMPVLSGCENFDPDSLDFLGLNAKKPLPGKRENLFPNGVPGVTQGIPPQYVKGYQEKQQQEAAAAAAQAAESEKQKAAAEKAKPKPKRKHVVKHKAKPKPKAAPAPQPAAQQQQQQQWPSGTQPQSNQSAWPAPTQSQQQNSPWPSTPAPGTFSR